MCICVSTTELKSLTVAHKTTFSTLTKLKLPTIFIIIYSFITNRTFQVRIDIYTTEEHLIKTSLSPWLINK